MMQSYRIKTAGRGREWFKFRAKESFSERRGDIGAENQ